MRTMVGTMLALFALAGCGDDESGAGAEVDALLSPREQLIRLSLDLRGVRPDAESLAAVEADPAAYDRYVDEYLQDPRFVDQMKDLYNGVLRTRTANAWQDPMEAGVTDPYYQVADSVGSEPLEIIGHVIGEGRPFSEILTADYTFADPIVAAMWGLEYPEGATGWQKVHYTDGRPAAGVLSTTSLWQRYPSAGLNANRHRANQVSRIFLCDDYLTRPVEFTRDALDGLTPEEATATIHENPTCLACHATLDPIAANFYGFWWEKEEGLVNNRTYVAGDEGLWVDAYPSGPAYYGRPVGGLAEFAQDLAADPRFHECTVKTVLSGITQRPVDADKDWEQVQALTSTFTGANLDMRALVRAIVTSDEYKAASFADATGERVPVVKTLSPRQLSTYVEDETGYVFTFDGADALKYPELGLVVLDGGIDGEYVVERSFEPSVSSLFVQERLAQAAGYRVATADLNRAAGTEAVLLKHVEITSTPDADRAAFEAQIRYLHEELVGVPLAAGAPEVDELLDLWKQAFSITASPTSAWAAVIAAVLRDPSVLFY